MSKPIEDAADIISQQNALIEELQAKLAAQAAPVVAASAEPVPGAFLNKNGGVTLTGAPIEEMPKRHAFAGYLYAAPATPAAQAQQPAGDGWISVDERLPPAGEPVLVFYPPQPHDWPGAVNIELDCIDPDDDDHASWRGHNQHYEHFCAVAGAGMTGPSEKAPYTHWFSFPPAPGLMEAE